MTTASNPRETARSKSAANLIFSLQRMQGLGVRPASYSAIKSSTTSSLKRSEKSHTKKGMPNWAHTRRASIESSRVQHPREPVRSVPGIRESAKCTPTTSCPASTARAAATAESTPPLIAAKIFTEFPYKRWVRFRGDNKCEVLLYASYCMCAGSSQLSAVPALSVRQM